MKLSIRDLCWLVLVVAMALGWFREWDLHNKTAKRKQIAQEKVEDLRSEVKYQESRLMELENILQDWSNQQLQKLMDRQKPGPTNIYRPPEIKSSEEIHLEMRKHLGEVVESTRD